MGEEERIRKLEERYEKLENEQKKIITKFEDREGFWKERVAYISVIVALTAALVMVLVISF